MNKTEKQLLIYGLPSLLAIAFALWKIKRQRIESEQRQRIESEQRQRIESEQRQRIESEQTQQSQQNKSNVIKEIKQQSAYLQRRKDFQEKDAIKKKQDYEDDNEDFSDVMRVGGHHSKQNITQKSKTIRKHRKKNKKQSTKNSG
jgi:hypothetical protein